jgi:hypothetical protein
VRKTRDGMELAWDKKARYVHMEVGAEKRKRSKG